MKREFPDELLSAYLDGELSQDERAAVEAEIAASADARQLLGELQGLSSQVRELPRHAAGQDFADRVMQAALAAKAQRNGDVELPHTTGDLATGDLAPSPVHRRRAIVPAALAGLAAVAAAIALIVWSWGDNNQGGPGQHIATIPGSTIGPDPQPVVTAAEQVLARLRLAIPQEGEAVVVRLRIGKGGTGSKEFDAALAAAGIGSRLETDGSTAAMKYGKAYHDKLVEKFGGQQPGAINQSLIDGTISPADAMFVEASLEAIEKALAALASKPESALDVAPVMSVAAAAIGGDPGEVAHGEAPAESTGAAPKFYAQRLNPGLFRLEKAFQAPTVDGGAPSAVVDATKPIRMLILIERATE